MHLWRVIFRQVTFVLLAALAVGEMARIVWPQRCPETAELAGLRMVSAINARALWGDSIVWVDARPRELGQRAATGGQLPLSMDDWECRAPPCGRRWGRTSGSSSIAIVSTRHWRGSSTAAAAGDGE